jgi:hypothetical protein
MTNDPPKEEIWELWQDETGDTYFPVSNASARKLLSEDAVLLWNCTAKSYNDAMQQMYDYRGWGKYKPIP